MSETRPRTVRCPRLVSSFLLAACLAACGSPSGQEGAKPAGESDAAARSSSPAPYTLKGKISLAGDMDDPTGTLVFCAGTSHIAYTDATGRFAISNVPPGVYRVCAQRPGYVLASLGEVALAPVTASAHPLEFSLADVEMQLEAGPRPYVTGMLRPGPSLASLGGRVVLPDGQSAREAVVRIEDTDAVVLTDDEGRFSLVNIQPGELRLLAEKQGYESPVVTLRVEPDTVTDLPNPIQLEALPSNRFTILGKVLFFDSQERVVETGETARVSLAEKNVAVRTAPDGSFFIEGLEPGTYTLNVSAPGFAQREKVSTEIVGDDALAILRLYEGETAPGTLGALTGVVVLQDNPGPDAAGVYVALAGTSHSGATAGDGRFSLDRVPPGAYTLLCKLEGFKTLQRPDVAIEPGQTADLGVLRMERDKILPKVLFSTPRDGARGIVIEPTVRLALGFNTKMRAESVRAALSISPPCDFSVRRATAVPETKPGTQDVLEILLSNENQSKAMKFHTRYTVALAASAQDLEGNSMSEPFRFSFVTAGLRALSSTPERSTSEISVTETPGIVFRFNGRVKKDTLNDRTVAFNPAPAMSAPVWRFSADRRTGWTILTIPVSWTHETDYRVSLVGRSIEAEDGTRMDGPPYVLRFRVRGIPAPPSGGFTEAQPSGIAPR